MTISFPRKLPEHFASGLSFELQRVDYLSPETGARVGSVSAGWPLWAAEWDFGTITVRKSDEMRAWVTSLRGSQRLFLGRDLSRAVPRFHANGRPYIARPTGWSQTIDAAGNAVLTLTGAQPAMVLSWGDYVGFEWGDNRRSLVRVVERGIANGSGQIVVTVEPPVHAVTPSNAAVNLDRPTCLMRLTSETDLGMVGRRLAITGGKIKAIQDLIP